MKNIGVTDDELTDLIQRIRKKMEELEEEWEDKILQFTSGYIAQVDTEFRNHNATVTYCFHEDDKHIDVIWIGWQSSSWRLPDPVTKQMISEIGQALDVDPKTPQISVETMLWFLNVWTQQR